MNEHQIKEALSFIVFNFVNHLNDRLFMRHLGNRMNIQEATDLSNDILNLLTLEHSKKAIRAYIEWCMK